MARIRSIKPEFWDDRKLAAAVSRDARLFYIGLWNFADEHSRANGDPVWLAGHIFPYESDIGPDECARYLDELARGAWVVKYTVEGDPYLFLPKLASHQRLEPGKVASKHPSPDEADQETPSDLHVRTSMRGTQVFSDQSEPSAKSSTLLYGSGSMEHVAGSMGPVPRDAEIPPQDDPTGALLAEHIAAYASRPPLSATAQVKTAIMALVAQGTEPDLIRRGLSRMRAKQLGPALLPSLCAEAIPVADIREPTPSRNSQALHAALRSAQANDAKKAIG